MHLFVMHLLCIYLLCIYLLFMYLLCIYVLCIYLFSIYLFIIYYVFIYNVFIYLLFITFTHLADAFIQSDLQCIQVIHIFFCQYMCSLGIEPTTFALLTQCSNHWATGTPVMHLFIYYAFIECLFTMLSGFKINIRDVIFYFDKKTIWIRVNFFYEIF